MSTRRGHRCPCRSPVATLDAPRPTAASCEAADPRRAVAIAPSPQSPSFYASAPCPPRPPRRPRPPRDEREARDDATLAVALPSLYLEPAELHVAAWSES